MNFIAFLFSIVAVILAATVVAVIVVGRENIWSSIGGDDLGPFDLSKVERSIKPHDALLATVGAVKSNAKIDGILPGYKSNPEALMLELDMVMAASGIRFKRVDNGSDVAQRRYITWTEMLRFPDTNQFEAVEMDGGQTALIAYARAHVGYSDNGNNLKRLKRLTSTLAN